MSNEKLTNKLLNSNSSLKSYVYSQTPVFDEKEYPTKYPILNLALSGKLNGGFTSGIITIAGESRTFKTLLSLIFVKTYLEQEPDAMCVFYDSEFSPKTYFDVIGIDQSRVIHKPIKDVEDLKTDLKQTLEIIEDKDKVIFLVDSIGNLASRRESDNAQSGNAAQDMSREKAMKSLFRIVTPLFKLKKVPAIMIAHTYKTIEMFSKDVISGGEGNKYAANARFIITKSQEKNSAGELLGWKFTINVDKSRYIKEKKKFPLIIKNNTINKYSGLLEYAENLGFVEKPSKGWYSRVLDGTMEEKKWRAADTDSEEFWKPLLESESFSVALANDLMLQLASDEETEE